jgi:hypothetical protein
MRELGQLVYEHGKHRPDELRPYGAKPHKSIGPEAFLRCNLGQGFYHVPPHELSVLTNT